MRRKLATGFVVAVLAAGALPSVRVANATAPRSAATQPVALRRVEVEGTSLAYIDRGIGEPVVLVHGTLGDLRSWRQQLQALSQQFRVIAYSRRNHHPNPRPSVGARYSIAQDASDLAGMIRALELGPVHLVGQGRGAEVCARFAAENPEMVRSLVLCEAALPGLIAGTDGARSFLAERNEIRQRASLALRDGFADVALSAYVDGAYGTSAADLPDSALALARDNIAAWSLELNVPAADEFGCDNASQIASPVLIVNGGRSPAAMRSFADAYVKCRPGTERVVLERAGYDVPREASGAFLKAVTRFLASPAVRASQVAGEASAR